MATRLQSYLSGPFRTRGTGQSVPWMANPNYNDFSQWESSPDAQVLKSGYDRSKLAHDALMRAEAIQADDDNEILATATPDELANLFGRPRTPREARLQKIVQRDYDAKEYGARLIPNELQKVSYGQKVANLKRTNLQNYLDPLKFGLEEARFGETQTKNLRDFLNQRAQRQHAEDQLAAQERYRQAQIANAAANFVQRAQFHQGDYNQRAQFHNDTVANQELQAMMEMERMLQAKADDEQRQRNFESQFNRGYFHDVARAAERGALPPDQMSQFANRFDPATMAIIKGYANAGAGGLAGNPTDSASSSPGYLERLRNMPIPFPGIPGVTIPNPFRTATGNIDAPIDWGNDSGDGADYGNEMDMGGDFTPPPAMAARPAPAAHPAQRGGFTPGQIIRSRSTGEVFRVMPNGQLQRVR